jgi:nucleoside-diphosphate-sugar epimerase
MKALVTGSAGFVGRHVVAELDRRGWDVVRIDPHEEPKWVGDALDTFFWNTTRYDLVVHAAASSPHRAAIDGEPQHMAKNLMLDAAMFDWAVRTRQHRVIYLSSSAAYPVALQGADASSMQFRLHEDFADIGILHFHDGTTGAGLYPDSVYGWTKLTGEQLAEQARRAGLDVTVVRPFSGYGEDQSENFPFRAIVERARRREDPFHVWGDGSQVRDWIHITDVVNGMLAVAESGTEEPVNLCTGTGTSMTELAEMACKQVGHTPVFEYLADKPGGVAYRVGDPTRFHTYHQPTVSLDEGVARALRS